MIPLFFICFSSIVRVDKEVLVMAKEKPKYDKAFKTAMQEMLTMTKDEITSRLREPDCTMAEKLAGAHILKDSNYQENMTTPQEGMFIAKLSGDLEEQISVKTSNFTDFIKGTLSEDEWERPDK